MIRILDHVERASTYQDGEVIYRILRKALVAREDVTVSFDGISAVPSAFVNAALLQLSSDAPFEEIRAHLRIIDSTKSINDLVRSRFTFVNQQVAQTS